MIRSFSESRLGFSLLHELSDQVRARVSPFLSDTQKRTELATNFLQKGDKLVFGPLVLLVPE